MRRAFVILSGLCLIVFPMAFAKAQFDPFDSYGAISWELEKVHLDNFAIALQHDADSIGYIIVYAGRRACVDEAKNRALRAKKYVVKTRGIQESRVKWLDGGYNEELTVILQPVPPGAPKLTPSPTIKPSDVQIIMNCRLKTTKRKKGGCQAAILAREELPRCESSRRRVTELRRHWPDFWCLDGVKT